MAFRWEFQFSECILCRKQQQHRQELKPSQTKWKHLIYSRISIRENHDVNSKYQLMHVTKPRWNANYWIFGIFCRYQNISFWSIEFNFRKDFIHFVEICWSNSYFSEYYSDKFDALQTLILSRNQKLFQIVLDFSFSSWFSIWSISRKEDL